VRGTGYGRYVPLPRSGYDRALAERVRALAARPMTVEDAVEVGLLADPTSGACCWSTSSSAKG
jgi:hypothetical protein